MARARQVRSRRTLKTAQLANIKTGITVSFEACLEET